MTLCTRTQNRTRNAMRLFITVTRCSGSTLSFDTTHAEKPRWVSMSMRNPVAEPMEYDRKRRVFFTNTTKERHWCSGPNGGKTVDSTTVIRAMNAPLNLNHTCTSSTTSREAIAFFSIYHNLSLRLVAFAKWIALQKPDPHLLNPILHHNVPGAWDARLEFELGLRLAL